MPVVTVRELRQNLSVYLRRVEEGETLSVTRRGEPVAVLAPLAGRGSILDRLVAEGRATAPTMRLEDLGPPLPAEGRPLSEILEEMREDER
jgi:prevent-host-death family protein